VADIGAGPLRASALRIQAATADARRLDQPDAGFDIVLEFGPLYHLLLVARRPD
jgi:hypothetical protein